MLQAVLTLLVGCEPVWGWNLAGQTPEEKILSLMRSREEAIKELLGEENATYTERQREQLGELINQVIDFNEMSRIALSRHWDKLTPEERSEFVDLFSRVVKKSSLQKLDIFHAVVEYTAVDIQGDKAVAKTVATYKRTKTTVDYRFHRVQAEWKVFDFLMDEVSTAESYKKSFNKIIRKHQFQGLMERLQKKLEEE